MSRDRWFFLCLALLAPSATACLEDLRPEVGEVQVRDSDPAMHSPSSGGGANGNGNGNGGGGHNDNGATGSDDRSADGGLLSDGGSGNDNGGGDSTSSGSQNGSGSAPDCPITDSDPAHDVSFATEVMPILGGCRCHDPGSDDPVGVIEVSLTIDGYESLRRGGDHTGTDIVIAGNPCGSILLQKLSDTPPFGERMPRDGPYLSAEERALLSDWIVEGARDN